MTQQTAGSHPESQSKTTRVRKPWYREWSEAIMVALILALIIRTFFFQAFKIPSGSMEDTLLIGDHLLVNKFIYGVKVPFTDTRMLRWREPQRGEIIVFEFPEDRHLPFYKKRDFIKRIIGLPGDVVEIRDKQVLVNGQPYVIAQEVHKEEEVLPGPFTPRDFMAPVTVPEDEYFTMGDNRDRSYDSRFWGFVKMDEIKGRALVKYWSWDPETHRPRWERMGRPIR